MMMKTIVNHRIPQNMNHFYIETVILSQFNPRNRDFWESEPDSIPLNLLPVFQNLPIPREFWRLWPSLSVFSCQLFRWSH